MIIEKYVQHMVEKYGRREAASHCAKIAGDILEATSHLVKVSSVARGAAVCVFIARLIEVMGVRGLHRSILPGKGVVAHQLLAVAFPRILRDVVSTGASGREGVARIAEARVREARDVLDRGDALYSSRADVVEQAVEDATLMAVNAVEFLLRNANVFGVELERARVYTELSLMSYRLHLWGVADAIVEDPESRSAVIIEWKSERREDEKTPRVGPEDSLQAYGYALLEADRLGYEDVFEPILEGRIGAVVIRPVAPGGRALPYYAVYPSGICTSRSCWSQDKLRTSLELIILLAEHLALVMASKRRVSQVLQTNWDIIEATCSIWTKSGQQRPVFNRIPEHPALQMYNPLRRGNQWPCGSCPYREACIYYVFTSTEPEFVQLRKEAWRTRYAVMEMRENALQPYKEVRKLILSHGNYNWIKGHVKTRILSDGNRVDLFDEAIVDEAGVTLKRVITRFERSAGVIVTLREGKPAVVYFNEPHVADPLLRLNFYGVVAESRYDETEDRIVVRIEPVSPPSRVYLPRLMDLQAENPDLFRNVLAFEVNVELTHLELLALDAYERGTYRALTKFDKEELSEAEQTLALIFGGLDWEAIAAKREG